MTPITRDIFLKTTQYVALLVLLLSLGATAASAAGPTQAELEKVAAYSTILKQGGVQYLQYGPAINVDASLVVSTAKARKVLMETLAKKDPSTFLKYALSGAERRRLPAAAQGYVEAEGAKRGLLVVIHRDDFANPKNSYMEYQLQSGATTYRLMGVDSPPVERSGATVTAQAYTIGSVAVVKAGASNITVDTEPPPLESVGEQKTLILLVDYQGSPARTVTPEQVKASLNTGNVGKYFLEESYGKASISADVYGWYRLPRGLGVNGEVVSAFDDGSVYKLIKDNNIQLANYKRVVLMDPGSYVSWSEVGVRPQLVDGVTYRFSRARVQATAAGTAANDLSGYEYKFAHEFGHSLGVHHANALVCRQGATLTGLFGGTCLNNEYGSPFEILGNGSISLTTSAAYRYQLGWLTSDNSLFVKAPTTATINALEASTGLRSAIIFDPATNLPVYSVERRKAIGYDSRLLAASPEDSEGLVVHRILRASDKGPFLAQALDLRPPYDPLGTLPKQLVLKVGAPPYTDPSTGVTLSTSAITADTVTFSVAYGSVGCVRLASTLADFVPYAWYGTGRKYDVTAGGTLPYRAKFISENSHACPPATYEIVATVPAGWSAPKGTLVAGSKNFFTTLTKIQVPATARGGKYEIPYTVRDTSSSWTFSDKFIINVIQPNTLSGEGGGDVNGDQVVTASDAQFALRIAVGQEVLGANKDEADVDCKEGVTTSDALLILRDAVGTIQLPLSCDIATSIPAADLAFTKEGLGAVSSSISGTSAALVITLNATPEKGYTFRGWQGACTGTAKCTLTLASSTQLTLKAVFAPTLGAAVWLALGGPGTGVSLLLLFEILFFVGFGLHYFYPSRKLALALAVVAVLTGTLMFYVGIIG